MSRTFNGSNEYLSVGSVVVAVAPLTMAAWARSTSIASNQDVVSIGVDGVNNNTFRLVMAGGVGGDPVRLRTRDTVNADVDTTTGYFADTWHHVCGVEVSTSGRAVYLDGGSKGTNATDATPTGMNKTSIGIAANLGADFIGSIAEVGIWNVALTDAEVLVLSKGYSPLCVRPQSLVFYVPLIRDDDEDLVGGLSLTASGSPGITANPRIIYPAQKHYSFPTGIKSITSETDLHSKGHQTFASSWHPDIWEYRIG